MTHANEVFKANERSEVANLDRRLVNDTEKKGLVFLERLVNELNRKRIFTDKLLRKIDNAF